MTPKLSYGSLISNFQKEIKTSKTFRQKNLQTSEMQEETKRQQETLRVVYQRESDIPKAPYETQSCSYPGDLIIPASKMMIQPKAEIPSSSSINMSMGMPIIQQPMMDPNFMGMMTPNIQMPMYMPKLMNPNSRPVNYRTEACKNFHSATGCTHGDACHFIHDFTYEGRPIPNMAEWRKSNRIRVQNMDAMKNMQMAYPMYYPPATEPHIR